MSRAQSQAPNRGAAVAIIDPKQAYESIEKVIVHRQQDIVATLARGIDPTTFLKVALQAITRTPKLLECTPSSFVIALRDAAELGLMPSGLLGEGYLVPYRNNGVMQAQFQAGYLGLVKLARQSGEVLDVEARTVREKDDLDIEYGSNGRVIHRPYIQGRDGEEEPGPYQGAWFRAKLRGGHEHIGWMSLAEIESVRRRSKAADNGPWVTDWPAMARKTVTRAESKWLPRSASLNRAMELEEIAEAQADIVRDVTSVSAAQSRLLARGGITVTVNEEALPPVDGSGAAEEPEAPTDTTEQAPAAAEAGLARCGAVHEATGAGPCILDADHGGTTHEDVNRMKWS